MKVSRRIQLVPVLAVLYSSVVSAQPAKKDSGDKPAAPSPERILIDQAIKDLKVFADGSTEPAEAHVVLRWPNNIRGTKDGATVILTSGGRPTAACCIYTWQGNELHYGLGSLSTKPVSAVVDGETTWHPTDPGVEFGMVPDAPEPATTASSRLRQMRQLSRRFSSRYYETDTKYDELRLLAKPIYRYRLGQPKADAEIFDGAVYAFVQGTDPESLLLIEARRNVNGSHWYYATAKRTVGRIDFKLDGKEVHMHKWGGWSPFNANEIFSTLRRPITLRD